MKDIPPLFEVLTDRRTIQWLFIPAVLLPVGIVFLFTFGYFFTLFGDPISAAVFNWLALGFVFFWFLVLVSLLFTVSWQVSADAPRETDSDSIEE